MKFQDILLPFILAMVTTWALQHFFFGTKAEVNTNKFSAPQSAIECKPIIKEISFAAEKPSGAPVITQITTGWGSVAFTTEGATISRLEFKSRVNGTDRILTTIYPQELGAKEDRAFMVALSEETPFYYKLKDQQETPDSHVLIYQAESNAGLISKTFIVSKNDYKLDMLVTVMPRKNSLQAQVFYPAPFMPQLKEENNPAGDVIDSSKSFSKTLKDYVKADEGWIAPTLFGAENKYFIHSMVKDDHGFAQRAYYKVGGISGLTAILESPEISTETTYKLSFYVGPKELSAIEKVDVQLEQAMDYSGWWAPISRILLKALNWLFNYLHNYGLAILVLTILIRLILAPFSLKAERSMKDRVEMQKRLQYIQQKYKNDPEAKAQAQADFMKKNGFGLGGCLPMLLQIPVFFGLSRVLASSIELYKAPFLWISDLSAPDPLYILPVIVVLGMLLASLNSGDASQRVPMIAMALVFGAASLNFSAGLVLYIAFSSVLNFVQTYVFKLFRLVR